MFRTTWKGLMARKLRLLTTAIAVALGVAFVAGTLVLSDTIGQTFDDLTAQAIDGTDAVVRGDEESSVAFGATLSEPRTDVPAELAGTLAELEGVAAAVPDASGYAQFVDGDGEPVGNPMMGSPTMGMGWIDDPDLASFELEEGRAPTAADEVVVDRGTARELSLAVGDPVDVLLPEGRSTFTVAGVATFGGQDRPAGATVALLSPDAAARAYAADGGVAQILLRAEEGVSQAELVERVEAALPEGAEALTGEAYLEESRSDLAESTSFFSTFLLVFAGIALFVGSFIIANTFAIVVAQRTRELGLLRALGASRRQVLGSVVLEALVIGVVASAVGLVLGVGLAIGLKEAMGAIGFDIPAGAPVVTTGTVVAATVTGVVVTVGAALLPALRASRTAPVVAMGADVARDDSATSRRRIASGAVVTLGGGALLATGLWAEVANPAALVGAGAFLVLVGVTVLGPVLAGVAARVLGAPMRRLRGVPGQLAAENAARNPARTSRTAAALMIGVALVGFITIVASSSRASVDDTLRTTFGGDVVLADQSGAGIAPQVSEQVSQLPGVEAVSGIRFAQASIDGEDALPVAMDTADLDVLLDVEVVEGSLGDQGLGTSGIAVHRDTAEARGLSVGDVVAFEAPGAEPAELEVAAVYDRKELADSYLVDTAAFDAWLPAARDVQVYAAVADGASIEEVRRAVDGLVADLPTVEVTDLDGFIDSVGAQIDQILSLVYVLLALAVLIALLGIGNTLALSVHERTRELGLLRAVGMSRRQLRSAIRGESVIIALFGTVLGIAVGTLIGWAIVSSLAGEGITVFSLPAAQLGVMCVLAALAGVLSARRPARRAARMDVLDALSVE